MQSCLSQHTLLSEHKQDNAQACKTQYAGAAVKPIFVPAMNEHLTSADTEKRSGEPAEKRERARCGAHKIAAEDGNYAGHRTFDKLPCREQKQRKTPNIYMSERVRRRPFEEEAIIDEK